MSVQAVDFAGEIRAMRKNRVVDKNSGIAIRGGELAEDVLGEFLLAWDFPAMPHRIWQYADRCDFVSGTMPEPARHFLLEHCSLFGPAGDLEMRRDGNAWKWHFIGESSIPGPQGFAFQEYWQQHPERQFRAEEGKALLWGEYRADTGSWHEDRVARRPLSYPIASPTPRSRVRIAYTALYDGGQVAFVWWKELQKA